MWDWWRIKSLHTPYEWALQIAMQSVEPIGEDRADLRAAVNTANLIVSQSTDVTNEQATSLIESMRGYLRVNQREPEVAGPAAIRQAIEG